MRLIDAEEFQKFIEKQDESADYTIYHFGEWLEQQPTIEAKPVVHGRWIGKPICGNDNCRCSECGSWHHIHANLRGEVMQKYCPNCGAQMGEKEDKHEDYT